VSFLLIKKNNTDQTTQITNLKLGHKKVVQLRISLPIKEELMCFTEVSSLNGKGPILTLSTPKSACAFQEW
jgi:hypothetical protein